MSLNVDALKSALTTTNAYMPFTVDNTIKYDYSGDTLRVNSNWFLPANKGLNRYIANQ